MAEWLCFTQNKKRYLEGGFGRRSGESQSVSDDGIFLARRGRVIISCFPHRVLFFTELLNNGEGLNVRETVGNNLKSKPDGNISNLKQLLDYFQQELPEGFWGNVIVKFKDGVPYLVEEQRQIKLDKAR